MHMQKIKKTNHSIIMHMLAMFCIGFCTFLIGSYQNQFSEFFHADELKKIYFIQTNKNDFHHPILMLSIARFLNYFMHESHMGIILIARNLTAIYASILCCFCFYLYQKSIPKKHALIASLHVGLTPIIAMHAHYIKEDMIFTMFMYILLVCIVYYPDKFTLHAILFGFSLASQYKAILLCFIIPRKNKAFWIKSLTVFLCVNIDIITNIKLYAIQGAAEQWTHTLGGHKINLYALPEFFLFYLQTGIAEGLGWPLCGVFLVSLFVLKDTQNVTIKKYYLCFILFWLSAELSPMKTFPDSMRYMIPCIPAVLGLIHSFFYVQFPKISLFLSIFCFIYSSTITYKYISNLSTDTRTRIPRLVGSTIQEIYTTYKEQGLENISDFSPCYFKKRNNDYLILSSFQYDRYMLAGTKKFQPHHVYERYEHYLEFFKLPYVEIKPYYKSFAFSNPTLRIIDLSTISSDCTEPTP